MRFPVFGYVVCVPILAMIGLFFVVTITTTPYNYKYSAARQNAKALVCQVAADPKIAGKVYADVQQGSCIDTPGTTYESTDYGQHWHVIPNRFTPKITPVDQFNDLRQLGDELWFGAVKVWTLPKRIFRSFFWSAGSNIGSFPPYVSTLATYYIAPKNQDVIYAPLKEYGVLVGPNPPNSNARAWGINHDGIDGIVSPITLTDPLTILCVIALGLLIPPLTFLHAWLIGQAYRYAFPIGEPAGAFDLALKVSGVITGCAAIAIFIWLTQEVIDFYLIVGVMTAITIIASVGAITFFAHKQGFTTGFILRIELATGLLSLIVPIGVVSTLYQVGWPIILTLIVGFVCYRHVLTTYLENQSARTTLWQTDRLALELLILFLVMLLPLSALVFIVNRFFVPGTIASWASFLVPLVSVAFVALYATVRGEGLVVKKVGTLKTDYHQSPLFWDVHWWVSLFWSTVKWLLGALGVSAVVYISQMFCYLWFNTLAR